MAGDMSTEKAIATPITREELTRFLETGAVREFGIGNPGVGIGPSEVLSMEDVRTALLGTRAFRKEQAIAKCLRSLRRDLRNFVNVNNRESESFGFGTEAPEPLNCSEIMKRVRDTVMKLEAMEEDQGDRSPLAMAQRSVIPQVTALLEDFLVDLTSIASEGAVGQSQIVPLLKSCINLSRVVGEVVQALSGMKMEMAGEGAGSRTR
jgi:hypothetical protein